MKRFSDSGKMPGTNPARKFGAWLLYRMRCAGITQDDVAADCGVTRQYVQQVMYGIRFSATVRIRLATRLRFASWDTMHATWEQEAAA